MEFYLQSFENRETIKKGLEKGGEYNTLLKAKYCFCSQQKSRGWHNY